MTEPSDETSPADTTDLASVLGGEDGSDDGGEETGAPTSSTDRPVRSRAAMFSWHQVGLIVDFAREFDGADEDAKRLLLDVVGWSNVDTDDVDLTSLAQALLPSGGVVGSFRFVSVLARKIATNSLGFAEGVTLLAELSEFSEKSVREVVRVANLLGNGDLKFRRNTPTPEILNGIVGLLMAKSKSIDVDRVDVVDNLLGIWPGEA